VLRGQSPGQSNPASATADRQLLATDGAAESGPRRYPVPHRVFDRASIGTLIGRRLLFFQHIWRNSARADFSIQNRVEAWRGTQPKKRQAMDREPLGVNVVRPARWQNPPPRMSDGVDGAASDSAGRSEPRVDDIAVLLRRLELATTKLRDDTAEIKARLSGLPNIWQLSGLVIAMIGLAFILLRYGLPTL
jgi:hypothetical protein